MIRGSRSASEQTGWRRLRHLFFPGNTWGRRHFRALPERAQVPPTPDVPHLLAGWEHTIIEEARPYTMTSPSRLLATIDAVAYVVEQGVPGALVECGVWRGVSVLAMIRTLQSKGVDDREIYLFDTFEGMTQPTEQDISSFDSPALETWTSSTREGQVPWSWAFDPQIFNLEAVRDLIVGTGYPPERVHFVQGRVEESLPKNAPASVSVLRLDTDWYESTWHELVHLFPRLSKAGVLIIDDYVHWDGCRRSVDQYLRELDSPVFLARSDYTGRIGIKLL